MTDKTVGTSSESQTGQPYYLDASTVNSGSVDSAPKEANTIEYKPCGDTGNRTGADVSYFNFSKNIKEKRQIGTCPTTTLVRNSV